MYSSQSLNRLIKDEEYSPLLSCGPQSLLLNECSILEERKPCRNSLSWILKLPREHQVSCATRLPPEIWDIIIEMLDVISVLSFARGCVAFKAIVDDSATWKWIIDNGSNLLGAFSQTKTLGYTTIWEIRAAVRTRGCNTCNDFAPFVFLPTCQRICLNCMCWNPEYWVIPTTAACVAFGVTSTQVSQLAVLHVQAPHKIVKGSKKNKTLSLVGVLQVKQMALNIHGSSLRMCLAAESRIPAKTPEKRKELYSYLRSASETSSGEGLKRYYRLLRQLKDGGDAHRGEGAVLVPYTVHPDLVEHGLWCLGCQSLFKELSALVLEATLTGILSETQRKQLYQANFHQRRAWSNQNFGGHVAECQGALSIVSKFEKTSEQ